MAYIYNNFFLLLFNLFTFGPCSRIYINYMYTRRVYRGSDIIVYNITCLLICGTLFILITMFDIDDD